MAKPGFGDHRSWRPKFRFQVAPTRGGEAVSPATLPSSPIIPERPKGKVTRGPTCSASSPWASREDRPTRGGLLPPLPGWSGVRALILGGSDVDFGSVELDVGSTWRHETGVNLGCEVVITNLKAIDDRACHTVCPGQCGPARGVAPQPGC
jgi:hypothetical protein